MADERLSLVMELGAVKDEFTAFQEKALLIGRRWRLNLTQEVIRSLIMATVVVLSSTTYVGASLKSQTEMLNPSVPLTAEFFANPRCPPGASAAAPALDLVAVIGEEYLENSPFAAGEEAVLPTDLPAVGFKFFVKAGLVLFSAFVPIILLFFHTLLFSIILCLLELHHPDF